MNYNIEKKDYVYVAYYLRTFKGDIVSLEVLGVSKTKDNVIDVCKVKKDEIIKEFKNLNNLKNEVDFLNYTSENCVIKNNETNFSTYNFSLEDNKEMEKFFIRMDKIALK